MNALNIVDYTQSLGLKAKVASALMAKAPTATKNRALRKLAELLRASVLALQIDNAKDIERALAAGLAAPMVDRLKLSPEVIETCAQGLRTARGHAGCNRRNHRHEATAQRHPGRANAGADWGLRHDFREPSQCDD